MKGNQRLITILGLIPATLASGTVGSQNSFSYYQNHEKGWHWYEIQELEDRNQEVGTKDIQKEQPQKQALPQKPKSPKEIVASYREELENRLADAWMHPTPHKIKAYQEMQKDMMDRSKTFSEGWMQNVFLNPGLDTTIANPVNQRARHVQLDLEKQQIKATIQSLAKEYGLFFFFSGGCEYCHQFAPIVKQFSEQYGWSVLPISLDGGQLEVFPNAQPDNGLFEQWQQGGHKVMPALFAVNPNTGHVIPIALGMTSIDQMEIRIMSLVGKNR
jgi:conjugal transfer pilus assembly protein TraF